jgi:hypothetical protein
MSASPFRYIFLVWTQLSLYPATFGRIVPGISSTVITSYPACITGMCGCWWGGGAPHGQYDHAALHASIVNAFDSLDCRAWAGVRVPVVMMGSHA